MSAGHCRVPPSQPHHLGKLRHAHSTPKEEWRHKGGGSPRSPALGCSIPNHPSPLSPRPHQHEASAR